MIVCDRRDKVSVCMRERVRGDPSMFRESTALTQKLSPTVVVVIVTSTSNQLRQKLSFIYSLLRPFSRAFDIKHERISLTGSCWAFVK